MADLKISELTNLTAADPANDMIPIVDVSATPPASGSTKRISINNILACSPTATLASATITGDLTVDTSTLKVDSANNRVGVLTASPAYTLDVNGVANFKDATVHLVGGQPMFARVGSANSFLYAGTTALTVRNNADTSDLMTLNSTGLLVGTTATSYGAAGRGLVMAGGSTSAMIGMRVGSNDTGYIFADATKVELGCNGAVPVVINNGGVAVTIDTNRNVGIGVTPSAWFSTWKVLQLAGGSFGGPSDRSFSLQNAIVNASGQFQYVSGSSTPASGYRQFNGAHDWYTAAAGTSPNQITDFATPKMTLESTGSLVLGAAAVATTATDGFLYIPGCAGTPTGTPTAKTGRVPLVVDTTNNKLYFYSGGAWVAAN